MRRIGLTLLLISGISIAFLGFGRFFAFSEANSRSSRRIIYYVDPMHPSYKSDKPGIAPDCGMQLVPVFQGQQGNVATSPEVAQSSALVMIDGDAQRLSGIRFAEVRKGSGAHVAQVVGRVTPEDVRIFSVNSGVDGFMRETYNDSVGTFVKKDQKLANYYSPEFLAAASGFLAATERVPGTVGKDGARFTPNFPGTIAKEGVRSVQGYTDHLRNLGMSDTQIKRIADTRELPDSIDVVAPTDGFILIRNVSPGTHYDHMTEFYKIADLSKVWVVAEVNEGDAGSLRPRESVVVTLRGTGRRMTAHVTDSLPQSEAGGGTVKVRLEVYNPSFMLRPDMLVEVDIPLGSMNVVTVPVDAIVFSGQHTRVYVQHSEGMFEPRDVEMGRRMGEEVEILQGVQPGDHIVVAGTFLVDSENRLKSATPVAMPSVAPAHVPGKSADMHGHMASMKSAQEPM
jgi:membrane fusion protein, copper/silver efflux system